MLKNVYNKSKLFRISIKFLIVIAIILFLLFLVVILFLKLWPAFGGKTSSIDRDNYAKRADNFNGEVFLNEHEFTIMSDSEEGENYENISTKSTIPKEEIPTKLPEFLENLTVEDVTVTWFGHSTILVQMNGKNILFDPVFSNRTSPVSFIGGSTRFSDLPIDIDTLPEIDICIISHDHYDHLDYQTILDIDKKVKQYIVPLGVENHLERWNVDKDKITNMAWWEELNIDGLTVACTPARHYTGRSLGDRFNTLWASWILKNEDYTIFESGDTGYDDHFKRIKEKYGDIDLALMDVAQYDIKWQSVHMNPDEGYQAIQDLNVKKVVPIHWGAFSLSYHPWDDPVERLVNNTEGTDIEVLTPLIGETMNMNENDTSGYKTTWWRDIE